MKRINNYQEIIQEIKNYQFVSFDLFDTLIKRDVANPSDVFQIIENRGYPGFKEERIASESKARQLSSRGEVTLKEIYDFMDYKCCKEEIDLEKELCTANTVLKSVYDYCLASKKTIIITTDIYLNKETVFQILDKCGYTNYNYLFVSSEYGQMKADGSLYDTMIKTTNIPAQMIIHIGDNKKSDYIMPRRKGIASILIDGKINHLTYDNILDYSSDESNYWKIFTNNHLRDKGYFYNTGYECFGPLLYGFVKWIIKKIEEDNIEKVFFLSRDGEIIKKVFDSIYSGNAKSQYLLVSRRALLIPSFRIHKHTTDFINAYHFPYMFTAEALCRMLGCEDSDKINDIIDETYSKGYVFYRDTIREDKVFESIFERVLAKQKDYIENQYCMLNAYLAQEEFCGRVAIIDIGWYGNMQKNLSALTDSFKINADIKGYYVAMAPSEELSLRRDMEGYLFDAFHNQQYHAKELLFNPVFELLFTGTHGTVLDYYYDSKVKARQGEFEIKNGDSLNLIREYQCGAIDFCRDAEDKAIKKEIDTEYVINKIFKQFLRPNLTDAKNWGNITHIDNDLKKLVQFQNNRSYYFLHAKKMVTDYKSSLWKIGFLKQLLICDFKYDEIVISLNSIKGKIKGKYIYND